MIADPAGRWLDKSDFAIIVGSEDGFTESEIARGETASISDGILRSETAALAAAFVLA